MSHSVVQDGRYRAAAGRYAAAIARIARGYEADADLRRDLAQDIHLALWQSFARFEDRCAERTWVYRIAHNVAVAHLLKQRRQRRLATSDVPVEAIHDGQDAEAATGERLVLTRLYRAIDGMGPVDRQVVLLYLDGLPASEIGEVSGLSPGAVAVRIHRAKAALRTLFQVEETVS